MKIRTDFVTNSSSTSFVIITGGAFEETDFLELMGVAENSPFSPIFEALYYQIKSNMRPVEEYGSQYKKAVGDWMDLLKDKFADEVVERIIKGKENGYKVFVGDLSSDNNEIESFFCTDSFEVENGKIYLNALECIW